MFVEVAIIWMQKSKRYRSKLEELVKTLKSQSSAVEKIGVHKVCFEDRFRIGKTKSNDTDVVLGLADDGLEVVVKRIKQKVNKTLLPSGLGKNERDFLNLSNLEDNSHVLNYRFYCEDDQYAYIVTDLQEGTLKDFVTTGKCSVDDLQVKGPTILKQILLGIQALHVMGILHRDLKPQNILVNLQGKMILADFGLCRQLKQNTTSWPSIMRGTEGWIAAECLPNDGDHTMLSFDEIEVRYRKSSDIQVLGMIFYFVLTKGFHPFGHYYFDRLSNTRKGKSNLSHLTDPVPKDLIEWMLQHDPKKRPTVKQCLKHPYILSDDDKFELLTAVGNEKEIKSRNTENSNSEVVRNLNQEASLTNPPWSEKIDEELYNHLDHPANIYRNNVVDLLHFIRNANEHWVWGDGESEERFGRFDTARVYFLNKFPTLPMIVHKIVRDSDWKARDNLEKFFVTM